MAMIRLRESDLREHFEPAHDQYTFNHDTWPRKGPISSAPSSERIRGPTQPRATRTKNLWPIFAAAALYSARSLHGLARRAHGTIRAIVGLADLLVALTLTSRRQRLRPSGG